MKEYVTENLAAIDLIAERSVVPFTSVEGWDEFKEQAAVNPFVLMGMSDEGPFVHGFPAVELGIQVLLSALYPGYASDHEVEPLILDISSAVNSIVGVIILGKEVTLSPLIIGVKVREVIEGLDLSEYPVLGSIPVNELFVKQEDDTTNEEEVSESDLTEGDTNEQ